MLPLRWNFIAGHRNETAIDVRSRYPSTFIRGGIMARGSHIGTGNISGRADSLDGETTTCGRLPVKKATPMLVKRSQPDHLT